MSLIPFIPANLAPLMWVRAKDSIHEVFLIIMFDNGGVFISLRYRTEKILYASLAQDWEWSSDLKEWRPCGIEGNVTFATQV